MYVFYILHYFNKHSCHVPPSLNHFLRIVLLTELKQSSLFGWKINTVLASDQSPHNFLLLPSLQVIAFVSTDAIKNIDMPACILLSEFDRAILLGRQAKFLCTCTC